MTRLFFVFVTASSLLFFATNGVLAQELDAAKAVDTPGEIALPAKVEPAQGLASETGEKKSESGLALPLFLKGPQVCWRSSSPAL